MTHNKHCTALSWKLKTNVTIILEISHFQFAIYLYHSLSFRQNPTFPPVRGIFPRKLSIRFNVGRLWLNTRTFSDLAELIDRMCKSKTNFPLSSKTPWSMSLIKSLHHSKLSIYHNNEELALVLLSLGYTHPKENEAYYPHNIWFHPFGSFLTRPFIYKNMFKCLKCVSFVNNSISYPHNYDVCVCIHVHHTHLYD